MDGAPGSSSSPFGRTVFVEKEEHGQVQRNARLRPVQVDNFLALRENFPHVKRILADMCTGAGKSGLACMAPYAMGASCKRVLWIGPTTEAREVAAVSLLGPSSSCGKHNEAASFLIYFGVLTTIDGVPPKLPTVLQLSKDRKHQTVQELVDDMRRHDITVATAQFFTTVKGRLDELKAITDRDGPIFDLHIYDECHYLPTKSWMSIWTKLSGPETRYLAMTGTPFRTDKQDIQHDLALKPFMLMDALAMPEEERSVKDLCFLELEATPEQRERLGKKKEKETPGASRVALVADEEVILSLLRATADLLLTMRSERSCEPQPHKALGFVANNMQAIRIMRIAAKHKKELSVLAGSSSRKLNIAFVWKDMKVTEYRRIMKRFKSAQLYSEDCIDMVIQAGCLSESFDAPFVSVAAVFHNSDSLVKFAQSIGRVVRRIGVAQTGTASNAQADALDNTAHVVVHETSGHKWRFHDYCKQQGLREELVTADEEMNQEIEEFDSYLAQREEGDAENMEAEELPVLAIEPAEGPSRQTISATRLVLAPNKTYHDRLMQRLQQDHKRLPWLIKNEKAANLEPEVPPASARKRRRISASGVD